MPRKPRAREATRRSRDANLLFDNGLRHSYIQRLSQHVDLQALCDQLRAGTLTPDQQVAAVASIPIAHRHTRLAEIYGMYAGLQAIVQQRRAAVLAAQEKGAVMPPGADTGLLLPDGTPDTRLVREAALLLRLAGEEMGEVQVAAQAHVEINVQQMIAVLSGVVK
jgi:hypothetical protein